MSDEDGLQNLVVGYNHKSREWIRETYDPKTGEWKKAPGLPDLEHAREEYRGTLIQNGVAQEMASNMAGTTKSSSDIPDNPETAKAREEYRDVLIGSGMTQERANRLSRMVSGAQTMENITSSESPSESGGEESQVSQAHLREDEPPRESKSEAPPGREFLRETSLGGTYRSTTK